MARGVFVQGVFVRGFLSGGLCPGGFCPGFFCPDTVWHIFQVKYLSTDSSNQYGFKVIFEISFVSSFHWLRVIYEVK